MIFIFHLRFYQYHFCSSAAGISAPAPTPRLRRSQDKLILRLNAVLQTPVVVFPRNETSLEVLVAHLGQISVSNLYLTQEQIYQYPGIYIDIQPLSDTGADISSYGYRYQTWHSKKHIQAWIGLGIGFCLVIKHSRINLRWRGDTSVVLLFELDLETWVNHVSWIGDLRFVHVLLMITTGQICRSTDTYLSRY